MTSTDKMALDFLPRTGIFMKKESNYLKVLLSQIFSNVVPLFMQERDKTEEHCHCHRHISCTFKHAKVNEKGIQLPQGVTVISFQQCGTLVSASEQQDRRALSLSSSY